MKRARSTECAICRGALTDRCLECTDSGEDRVCLGPIHNATCSHEYHMECIQRWLCVRPCCPLCNGSWVFPNGLSLKELAVAPFVDNEKKIVDLVAEELDPAIYKILDCGLCTFQRNDSRQFLPTHKQRLLAHAFGQYLDIAELEALLKCKKSKLL